jgi:hypothetical protein
MTRKLCVLVLAASACSLAQDLPSPDRALQVLTPPARTDAHGAVSATLQNAGSQPITAYAVRWTIGTFSNVSWQEFFPSLGFEAMVKNLASRGLAGRERIGVEALPPGGTITARNAFADYPDREATVAVVAVIFADSTAVGDADEIQRLFQRRKAQADILGQLVDAASKLDRSDARGFFVSLGKLPHGSDDSDWVHQEAELQIRPDLPRELRVTPDGFMEMLQARYSAAKANSTRR